MYECFAAYMSVSTVYVTSFCRDLKKGTRSHETQVGKKKKKTDGHHVGAGSGPMTESAVSKELLSPSTATRRHMPVLAASSFLFVPSGQMLTGQLGNSLLSILKGKPASMLSYSSRDFSGIQTQDPASQAHYCRRYTEHLPPPDSTCSSPSAQAPHMESPLYITKATAAPVLLSQTQSLV